MYGAWLFVVCMSGQFGETGRVCESLLEKIALFEYLSLSPSACFREDY